MVQETRWSNVMSRWIHWIQGTKTEFELRPSNVVTTYNGQGNPWIKSFWNVHLQLPFLCRSIHAILGRWSDVESEVLKEASSKLLIQGFPWPLYITKDENGIGIPGPRCGFSRPHPICSAGHDISLLSFGSRNVTHFPPLPRGNRCGN